MVFTFLPTVTLVSFLQFENAFAPIEVTLLPIVMVVTLAFL